MVSRNPPKQMRKRAVKLVARAFERAVGATGFAPADVDWDFRPLYLTKSGWTVEVRTGGASADEVMEGIGVQLTKLDPAWSLVVKAGPKDEGVLWCGKAEGRLRYDALKERPRKLEILVGLDEAIRLLDPEREDSAAARAHLEKLRDRFAGTPREKSPQKAVHARGGASQR